MGLFLTMLACKSKARDKVIKNIIKIMKDRKLKLYSKTKVNSITGEENEYNITSSKNNWIQVFCPKTPDDDLAITLSKKLNSPIFQFHIHDGQFWMYQLFVNGNLIDRHKPISDYWSKISNNDRKSWKGNANKIGSIFNLNPNILSPYLVQDEEWNTSNKRAFTEDEFPVKSEWSMVDFQRKLGIIYPEFERPNTLNIVRLTFKRF